MKIALDATYSVGANLSGVGVYSRALLRGLARAHPADRFQFCYRPHRFLRSFHQSLPANARRYLLGERHAPGSADLFHGLNQRLPHARLRHTVTTFHDLFVLTGEYSTPDFRRRFAAQARDAATRSDLILAVSDFTARQVIDLLGVDRTRVRTVHHGVSPPGHVPPLAARARIILHVGAIQQRKNIARLVEAFERVDTDWQLALAGSAGFGAAQIEARIAASPARARIRILGYLSDAELNDWYARSLIFAFPSLDEGFGMPVLEAMAYGLPVIASNCTATPEVAGDAAYLVNPHDVEELTVALLMLTADPVRRADLSLRGYARAQEFTWGKTIENTWQAYRTLTG